MPPDSPADDDGLDDVLRDAVSVLRVPVGTRPDAVSAVKLAVRTADHSWQRARELPDGRATNRRGLRWLITPSTIRVAPMAAIAATLLIVAGASFLTTTMVHRAASVAARTAVPQATVPQGAAPQATAREQMIRFTVTAPGAHAVSLVGDFNDWNPAATALQLRDGTWTVYFPVPAGRHQYGFVVDGSRWIADPTAPQSPDSDFGTANSVVYVEN